MILSALAILALVVLLVAIGLIMYARWNYGVLEATGIPVIKPSFFMGSVPNLHLQVQTDEDVRRYKEYGPIWGLYEGRTPIIYICDPDLMRSIFIKDIDFFFDRRVAHFGDPRIDEILDYLPGERWKVMRKMQTVLFSTGKIRQYSQQLSDAAFDFVHYLKNKLDENGLVKIETRSAMDIVSLDGIARVSFGIKLENVEDPNNLFFRALRKLLGDGLEYDWLYSLSHTFPFLHNFAPSFRIDDILFDTFKKVIDNRREENEKLRQQQEQNLDQNSNPIKPQNKCNDLADLLADSFNKIESEEFKRLGFSETTILAQALNVTALDMISAIMTMITYYLAKHPQVQQKLYEEIDEVINRKYKGRIDHETIHDMPYLTACMNESLRLAPPLIRPERVCTKDWVSPDGSLKIKKGTVVMVPLWAAHRNPKYFPNPEEFDPERFMPEGGANKPEATHPCAYSPFGLGPRNCIAMRLGIETLKVNVAIILKNFRIEPRPDTKLECKPGVLYLLQFKPLYLNLISREVEARN